MGEPNNELMENLKLYSATKYAKTRKEVEKEINERWTVAEAEKPAQAQAETAATKAVEAPTSDEKPKDGFLDGWLKKSA